jgi:hypothetical protein
MIGYNRLGSNGRLGNQMFQYAALRGIASKHNYEWVIPPCNSKYEANYGLFDCFKMESVKEENFGFASPSMPTLMTEGSHFDENFFNNCPDNCNLGDYFQTEKYFKNVESLIRKDFTFVDGYYNSCKEFIDQFDSEVIFLHVRRTDYVNIQHHHSLCTFKYYEEALKEFDDSIPVLIFSDDIDWCSKQELFSSDRFLLSNNNERYSHMHMDADGQLRQSLVPYTDLCLMSLCSHAIIANSSFSWWGAWLISNPNKKIIAPTPWYGPQANNDTKDLIPETWIVKEL